MLSVRRNTFETNSSSSHSLTLIEDGYYTYDIEGEADYDNNTLVISLGEYGWEWVTYDTPIDRLRYLLTNLACVNGLNTDRYYTDEDESNYKKHFYELPEFLEIVDAIKRGTNGK